jgi:hypothetical protein
MSGKEISGEQDKSNEAALFRKWVIAGSKQMLRGEGAFGDPSPGAVVRRQNVPRALKYLIWKQIEDNGTTDMEVAGLLPVRVYLPREDNKTERQILEAIDGLTAGFGLEVLLEFQEVRGSWFKTWIMNVRRAASAPEVADRLQKVERALELKVLGLPQAQVDAKQAHAVAELIRALARTPEAFVQIGALIIAKHPSVNGGAVCVRTLTPEIVDRLEADPTLLSVPSNFLKIIEHLPRKEEQENNKPDQSAIATEKKTRKQDAAMTTDQKNGRDRGTLATKEKTRKQRATMTTDQKNVAEGGALAKEEKKADRASQTSTAKG